MTELFKNVFSLTGLHVNILHNHTDERKICLFRLLIFGLFESNYSGSISHSLSDKLLWVSLYQLKT